MSKNKALLSLVLVLIFGGVKIWKCDPSVGGALRAGCPALSGCADSAGVNTWHMWVHFTVSAAIIIEG